MDKRALRHTHEATQANTCTEFSSLLVVVLIPTLSVVAWERGGTIYAERKAHM